MKKVSQLFTKTYDTSLLRLTLVLIERCLRKLNFCVSALLTVGVNFKHCCYWLETSSNNCIIVYNAVVSLLT